MFGSDFEKLGLRFKNLLYAIAISCPIEWNRLPSTLHDSSISLSTFKKTLKTLFFQCKTLWAAQMRALWSLLAF